MMMSAAEYMEYAMKFLGVISPFVIVVLSTLYAEDLIRLLRKATKINFSRDDY